MVLTRAIERLEGEIAALFHKLPYKPEDFPVGNITSLATLIPAIEYTLLFYPQAISVSLRLVSSKLPDW